MNDCLVIATEKIKIIDVWERTGDENKYKNSYTLIFIFSFLPTYLEIVLESRKGK